MNHRQPDEYAWVLVGCISTVIVLVTLSFTLLGPVVYTDPPFPSIRDEVTVFFDAKEGNGALAGYEGDVYAHTGLITGASSNGTDWKNVVGNWGTADARTKMTRVAEDLYQLKYQISDYYAISTGEEVLQMAFVFRNESGSIVGRAADGSDIFIDLFPPESGLLITLRSPTDADRIIFQNESLPIDLILSDTAELVISDNDSIVFTKTVLQANFNLEPKTLGDHELVFTATNPDTSIELKINYFVLDSVIQFQDAPDGMIDGVNYATDSTYGFQLFAPDKAFAFLLCPANAYQADEDFLMQRDTFRHFWIEVPRSTFRENQHTYQYLVEGEVSVADPYSEVVLDPNNDGDVKPSVLATLPNYPLGAQGIVTAFDESNETISHASFVKPDRENLVIYELMLRDFLADHSYSSLLDTLDYFEKLGVTAIELMPIQEFEGNQSWGYNPSFHMAVDKYYGTRDQLRTFIDSAHARGIAVILDVVFNHAFSQSPLAQLYWDQTNFRPAPDNPWLNVTARHPFNVGYDFNHESVATKNWVKRILTHWITQYGFDGFRFDLSKGLTQFNSGSDAGLMARRDPSRIAILKDYADHIWSLDSTSYVIMEHFAENAEELELADYGMLLWSNANQQFSEAASGRTSILEGIDYTARGWRDPSLLAYMESHDEERIMYRVLNDGESEDGYNTRQLSTALKRIEAISAIYYSIPGPKLLWQFGEVGYDYSINRCVNGQVDGCRLDPKPIRWDYFQDADRAHLFKVTSALLHLRQSYPTFSTRDFEMNDTDPFIKTITLFHAEMDAFIIANFNVRSMHVLPGFPYTGKWYDYFSGDSLEVLDLNDRMDLAPGAYHVYTSNRISMPGDLISNISEIDEVALEVFPNPILKGSRLSVKFPNQERLVNFQLIDLQGRVVNEVTTLSDGGMVINAPAGFYMLRSRSTTGVYLNRIVVQ